MKKLSVIFMAVFAMMLFMEKGYVYADWSGNMTVGANLTSGNTNGSALSFDVEASKRALDERYTLKGSFDYEEKNDELTVRKSSGSVKVDKFLTEALYVYGEVGLSKDEFKNIQMLTEIGSGVGYLLSPNLSLEGGLTYNNKDVVTGNDEQWTTARLGMNYFRDITDTFRFEDALTINPSLEDFGLYTLSNEADFIVKFSDKWSGKVTHTLGYDKDPSPGVEKLDTKLTAGLTYNF